MVATGPVDGEASADDGEEVGAAVGNLDPWEDEEPGVVNDQREVFSRTCGVIKLTEE